MAPKKKTAMDLRLENMERAGKAASDNLKSAGENLRAAAALMRKRGR